MVEVDRTKCAQKFAVLNFCFYCKVFREQEAGPEKAMVFRCGSTQLFWEDKDDYECLRKCSLQKMHFKFAGNMLLFIGEKE